MANKLTLTNLYIMFFNDQNYYTRKETLLIFIKLYFILYY